MCYYTLSPVMPPLSLCTEDLQLVGFGAAAYVFVYGCLLMPSCLFREILVLSNTVSTLHLSLISLLQGSTMA